jgi:hypothetical protein
MNKIRCELFGKRIRIMDWIITVTTQWIDPFFIQRTIGYLHEIVRKSAAVGIETKGQE